VEQFGTRRSAVIHTPTVEPDELAPETAARRVTTDLAVRSDDKPGYRVSPAGVAQRLQ
jgi:hypothetical protein